MIRLTAQIGIVLLAMILFDFIEERVAFGRLMQSAYLPWAALLLVVISLVLVNSFPEYFRREMPFIAFLVAGVVSVTAPTTIDQLKFYEVTAQVVPVLFLALAVEHRAFRVHSERTEVRSWLGLLSYLLAIGYG
jgi:hypothetical protein